MNNQFKSLVKLFRGHFIKTINLNFKMFNKSKKNSFTKVILINIFLMMFLGIFIFLQIKGIKNFNFDIQLTILLNILILLYVLQNSAMAILSLVDINITKNSLVMPISINN
ncbi:hypothetical protein, partial [Oceanivirga salmonicida]|uniref:hypothetical protein n=1 Tax=Oceanivirga salmonicida TaxID=1769291 RepID=UPI0018D23705